MYDLRQILIPLAATLLLMSLAAPSRAADEWTEVRTKNFYLIGDAAEKDLRQAASRLERFRESFRILFPRLRLDGGIPTNVIVFKDAASYAKFRPKRPDGSADGAVAGYFLAGKDVNYITLLAGDRTGSYRTMFHEYVHFLLDTNIGRADLPPWLGEGLAEYFETVQFPDDQRIVLGTAPVGHLDVLRQNGLIPFPTFLAIENSALHGTGDEPRSLFYAQAWALAHYLFSSGGTGGTQLTAVLASATTTHSPAEMFAKLFGSDRDAIEAALRDYIQRPLPTNRVFIVPRNVSQGAEASAAPLPGAKADAFLGDLLFRMGEPREAEVYLRRALQQDAGLGLANSSLGMLLVQARRFAEARPYLERAIAAEDGSYLAHFNYAYSLSRESENENGRVSQFPAEAAVRMRRSLQRAIALNPDFAESYRLLAFIDLVNDGDLDEAVAFLNKGLAIRSGDQNMSLLLAQILLRQEKYEEAGRLAERVAAGATDPAIWSAARSVVWTVDQYNAGVAAGARKSGDARSFGPMPPLILKRSTVSDEEVARYDEDRQLTNLNLLIDRPAFGEKQVVGYVDKMTCRDGDITYAVRTGAGESFNLMSRGFGNVGLRVLTEGERTFTLDCGVSLANQLAAITFRPSAAASPGTRGQLISIAFVPDFFRLKTPHEMAAARLVIIEDDRLFRKAKGEAGRPD